MNENIFREACLIQLSTPCWMGSRMLASSIMEQIGDCEWVRGRKYLVDQETLSPIRSVISRARKDLEKGALPFPITGLTLVPKDCLNRIEEQLREYQTEFWEEVDDFIAHYEDARENAKMNLGDLFNELDYPVDIRSKFGFEWRFFTLGTPGKHSILTPEIYERELAKFQSMMEETRDLAMAALRQEFADHVDHIVERLTKSPDGKPKIFKNSMIEKTQEFLDSFTSRNLFNDDSLAGLVAEAKEIIGGVKPGWIREDVQLQRHVREKLTAVKELVDRSIVDLPRRKIRIAA